MAFASKLSAVHYALALSVLISIACGLGWLHAAQAIDDTRTSEREAEHAVRTDLERQIQALQIDRDKYEQKHRDALTQLSAARLEVLGQALEASDTSPIRLTEGPVEISFMRRQKKTVYGPSEAKLVKVWSYDRDKQYLASEYFWLQRHYREKANDCLYLHIDGTHYCLIIIDGIVQPLLRVGNQSEIWRIEGLAAYFQSVRHIEPSRKKVTLEHLLGDAHSRLTLDFSQDFKITYDEGFHGP